MTVHVWFFFSPFSGEQFMCLWHNLCYFILSVLSFISPIYAPVCLHWKGLISSGYLIGSFICTLIFNLQRERSDIQIFFPWKKVSMLVLENYICVFKFACTLSAARDSELDFDAMGIWNNRIYLAFIESNPSLWLFLMQNFLLLNLWFVLS